MVIELKEEMKTRFLYDGVYQEFVSLLEKNIGKTIDLSDCMFGNRCANLLVSYYNKITFINSKNSYNNEVLEYNTKLSKMKDIKTEPLRVDFVKTVEMLQYIESLSPNNVYSLENYGQNEALCIAFVIIITCRRPEIMINMGARAGDIFRQIRVDWLPSRASHHDEYVEVSGSSVVHKSVEKGYVYMPSHGMVDEDIYVTGESCLPAKFGSEVINFDDPEFENVLRTAVGILNKVRDKTSKIKTCIE